MVVGLRRIGDWDDDDVDDVGGRLGLSVLVTEGGGVVDDVRLVGHGFGINSVIEGC